MTTILPQNRSSWDVIGSQIGQNISQNLPGAVQQGFQRQTGMNAIDQLQQELSAAGGDINKMMPAIARAYTANPNLERSGIAEHALRGAKTNAAFPGQSGQPGQPIQGNQPSQPNQMNQPREGVSSSDSNFATPSPFNIMTTPEMQQESERYAKAVNDPNAAAMRFTQLENQNNSATSQRTALEDTALKSGVKPSELPRFMTVNSHIDPTNPSEWSQKAIRNYAAVKSNDDKLEKAFIPGLGSGLIGRDRDEALSKLTPTVQDQVKRGLEQETRKFLTDNYLSPTEVERQIHPTPPKVENALKKMPKGIFPAQKGKSADIFSGLEDNTLFEKPTFVSYEEAREKDPKGMKVMQDRLSDFFLKNVDDKTSLLDLTEKLWSEKDYDWRQMGPAIREAQNKGLKLSQHQSTELSDVETQPPQQSLPDIFKDLWRIPAFLRGNK